MSYEIWRKCFESDEDAARSAFKDMETLFRAIEAEKRRSREDRQRLDWIQSANTLHTQTEFLYVVDGYRLAILNDKGVDEEFEGASIRECIDKAVEKRIFDIINFS